MKCNATYLRMTCKIPCSSVELKGNERNYAIEIVTTKVETKTNRLQMQL